MIVVFDIGLLIALKVVPEKAAKITTGNGKC
jgi:hypothetical protein